MTCSALEQLHGMPGHLIRRAQQMAVAVFVGETAEFDVTPVQYAALTCVRSKPGLDQTQLVNLIALDRSTVADVVDRLATKGLLARRSASGDKRRKTLFLTRAGKQLHDAMTPAVMRAQRRMLARLDARERTPFLQMLARVSAVDGEAAGWQMEPSRRVEPKPSSARGVRV